MTRVVVIATIAFAVACTTPPDAAEGEGEGEGEEESCALSGLARELIEQHVNELFLATSYSTTQTHGGGGDPVDLAFGADLVALNVGVLQNASFVFPCTEPTTFEPSCESTLSPEPLDDPFFEDHDRCFRLGCAGVDQPTVDVYFTMKPNTSAEERHEFTTETASPAGTSVYRENPLWRWTADLSTPGTVLVDADIGISHVFTLDDETVNVSHTGRAEGVHIEQLPDDVVTVNLTLSFDALEAEVEVHADEEGELSGGITVDGEELATLSGPVNLGSGLPFRWVIGCE
jgi:hypothetical protein